MWLAIAFLFVLCLDQSLGYDYASACVRPARAGRVKPEAPCDLSKLGYCTTPGAAYPWHAIRRFVRENQGLMRRMYGVERHIAVLKAELENFIEDDDEEKTPDFAEDILKTKMKYMKKSQRGLRDKPHFRPVQDKKKVDYNDRLKVKPLNSTLNPPKSNNTEQDNKTEISNETINDEGISYRTKLESIANIEINNLDPDVITLDAVIKQSIETNSIYPTAESKNAPTANANTDIFDVKNSTQETKTKNVTDKINNTLTTTEVPILTEMTTELPEYDETTVEPTQPSNGWQPMSVTPDSSTLPPTLLFSEHEKNKMDRIEVKVNELKEEFHPKPQHQESIRPAVITLRGANACESKEEMAAPFWANNTRGEVLALLNMYPFEQYIHLETCVHEKKQMYCREGCRCEQQFRLHRLLAYDPRNECRGIFADWFKFPACCVCKCYDVPLEFRARSPRILHPQYDEDVKRIIYEDVARDWYSISAYDDEIDAEDFL